MNAYQRRKAKRKYGMERYIRNYCKVHEMTREQYEEMLDDSLKKFLSRFI